MLRRPADEGAEAPGADDSPAEPGVDKDSERGVAELGPAEAGAPSTRRVYVIVLVMTWRTLYVVRPSPAVSGAAALVGWALMSIGVRAEDTQPPAGAVAALVWESADFGEKLRVEWGDGGIIRLGRRTGPGRGGGGTGKVTVVAD